MGVIIKKRRHLYSRIPLGLLIILFIALGPIIIGMIGASISEFYTGEACHEGNCFWGALGWFAFVTIPFAGFVFFIFLVIVIIDMYKLRQ